jgi:hypothetical protein
VAIIAGAACAALAAWLVALLAGPAAARAAAAHHAKEHFACSAANSTKVPCRFSTPSGNIRCLWTPAANSVACDLVATHRGYRLRPTGRARAVHLALSRRGEALPTNQDLVFPQSMSCHDTKTTMTCNQDFLPGFFKLAPRGSRSA